MVELQKKLLLGCLCYPELICTVANEQNAILFTDCVLYM